jgi:hydroxymethylbilane synthase
LRKVEGGEYDAIVLAKAGLDRLEWSNRITEIFSPEIFMPAVGQGAIAIEARAADLEAEQIFAKLDDAETRASIIAERALLSALQGGCQVPIGAWARIERGEMVLEAAVTSTDGLQSVKQRLTGSPDQAAQLGQQLAQALIDAGAQTILAEVSRQRE